MPIIQHKERVYAGLLVDALRNAKGAVRHERIARFTKLLKRTGDLKIAGKVVKSFERAWARRDGEIALAVTARPLTEAARKKLAARLKAKGYVLQEKVDPKILGGVALRLGEETMVDGTIVNKLRRLQE